MMSRSGPLTPLDGHPLQSLCVETIEVQSRKHMMSSWHGHKTTLSPAQYTPVSSPVDDVDHAVLTVVGAVNAEFIQKIQ